MAKRWRYETIEGEVVRNDKGGFMLAFPALPDGAVPVEVQTEFDDFTTHQPSGYTLTIQVPHPDGRMRCASDCPACHADHAHPRQGGAHEVDEDAGSAGAGAAADDGSSEGRAKRPAPAPADNGRKP